MALPLLTPTFYRLPDVNVTSGSVNGFLDAVYGSLTSSVDYRGTIIPSTHAWTWARYQSGSITEAVYNTAVPTGTQMTQNPCIILAGVAATASLAATMQSTDTFTNNVPMIGLVKNPAAFLAWNNANPMTSGQFSGYTHLAGTGVNTVNTIIRSYVSQESIFFRFIINYNTQFWAHAGAIIEPFTSYSDSYFNTIPACETDDRIYGVTSVGSANSLIDSFAANTQRTIHIWQNSVGGSRFFAFDPTRATTTYGLGRQANFATSFFQNVDFSGATVLQAVPIFRYSATSILMGISRSIYYQGAITNGNKPVIKNGNTDLYHILAQNLYNSSVVIYLTAAP